MKTVIKTIRPHNLFNEFETKNFDNRFINIILPNKETPLLLETAVLLSLLKTLNPSIFFEIGTLIGYQTLNIAKNMHSNSEIYTLDLSKENRYPDGQSEKDRHISDIHFLNENNLAFFGTKYEDQIKCLFGDSKEFDFSPYYKKVDMVYIDGGHDFATVKSDTENALKLMSDNKNACIIWHDYKHPNHPSVESFLDQFSVENKNRLDIYHVEKTVTAFCTLNIRDFISL